MADIKNPPPEEFASDLMPDEPDELASDLMPDAEDEPDAAAPAGFVAGIPAAPAVAAPGFDPGLAAAQAAAMAKQMEDLEAAKLRNEEERKRAEEAAAQLQAIISTVLEAAEVANKAAGAAASSHKAMNQASILLTGTAKKATRNNSMLVIGGSIGMVVGAGVFMAMAVQLQQRVSQADALLVKVGTQAIEIRESLNAVSNVEKGISGIAQRDGQLMQTQAEVASRIEALDKSLLGIKEEFAKKEAEMKKALDAALKEAGKPDPQLAKLAADLKSLDSQIKAQSKSLSESSGKLVDVTKEVQALKRVGGNVETLKTQVEALVTLEKQRYKEALQAAANRNQKETAVQFPRRESEAKPQ